MLAEVVREINKSGSVLWHTDTRFDGTTFYVTADSGEVRVFVPCVGRQASETAHASQGSPLHVFTDPEKFHTWLHAQRTKNP